jgi:hypothetical protein
MYIIWKKISIYSNKSNAKIQFNVNIKYQIKDKGFQNQICSFKHKKAALCSSVENK